MAAAKVVMSEMQGGKIGGAARAANMTDEQRSEGARKASQARWARVKAERGEGA